MSNIFDVSENRVWSSGLALMYFMDQTIWAKSSLAAAIRAALLLQTSSKESEEFVSWYGSGDPYVELVFESEPQRIWRVKKTFGNHPQAFLEESRDGVDFHVEVRGGCSRPPARDLAMGFGSSRTEGAQGHACHISLNRAVGRAG